MSSITVQFSFHPGIRQDLFREATLVGSWDQSGRYSDDWSSRPMQKTVGSEEVVVFEAEVPFDRSQIDRTFRWGVRVMTNTGKELWGMPTEVSDRNSDDQTRSFVLAERSDPQIYRLTHLRYLGANPCTMGDGGRGIRFGVWAPNARNVDVVFGSRESGYIYDDGRGIQSDRGPFPMKKGDDGVWMSDPIPGFKNYDHHPYMFRIVREDGTTAYRTDLYSRCQIGSGAKDPALPDQTINAGPASPWDGKRNDLKGQKSCSVVVDPLLVTAKFKDPVWPEQEWLTLDEFWRDEFPSGVKLPTDPRELVIYELHIGSLGFGKTDANGVPVPGNFEDAIALLDHIRDLGVNAVELLPMSEYEGVMDWGYSTSHYFALEFTAGGRDQFKYFVRECHRRGLAVIMDVCYNHYTPDGERAEWYYDSDHDERNIYYWYEGNPSSYRVTGRYGGYVDNMSTGYAPAFHSEMVRKLFISSAIALIEDFHVDGFRLDQTTSIHSYNVLHENGSPVPDANIFGAKFLREYSRTLKMIKPDVILIAEDHSGWEMVTRRADEGGLGMDAAWYSEFYHHLVGTKQKPEYACLVSRTSVDGDLPLAMDRFAGAFAESGNQKVVYNESHDEAGNSTGSGRTMNEAVNWAPSIGETRWFAEARSRFAAGMALLSPGIPMFFMGEEVASTHDFIYSKNEWDYKKQKVDFVTERSGNGKNMYTYYADLISLRRDHSAFHSPDNFVFYVHNANRVIGFRRWGDGSEFLVIGTLNNSGFADGYVISSDGIPGGNWREIFNSDSSRYGGRNLGNDGATLSSAGGNLSLRLPACGLVVLRSV